MFLVISFGPDHILGVFPFVITVTVSTRFIQRLYDCCSFSFHLLELFTTILVVPVIGFYLDSFSDIFADFLWLFFGLY